MGRTMTDDEGARETSRPNSERAKLDAPLPEKLPIPLDGAPAPTPDDGRVKKFVLDAVENMGTNGGNYVQSERRRFRRSTKPR